MIPTWKRKPILPLRSAQDEMFVNDIMLHDAVEILTQGFDCSRSRRNKNTYKRCIQKGKKIIKIVAVDLGDHFVITHVGTFTASKKKLQQLKRR